MDNFLILIQTPFVVIPVLMFVVVPVVGFLAEVVADAFKFVTTAVKRHNRA